MEKCFLEYLVKELYERIHENSDLASRYVAATSAHQRNRAPYEV